MSFNIWKVCYLYVQLCVQQQVGFQPRDTGTIEQIFGFLKLNLTYIPFFARAYTVKRCLLLKFVCIVCLSTLKTRFFPSGFRNQEKDCQTISKHQALGSCLQRIQRNENLYMFFLRFLQTVRGQCWQEVNNYLIIFLNLG